jgi:ABC-2 type transport system permease protein
VIGRPGSTHWLLAHEARLGWRSLIGGRRSRARLVVLGVVGAAFALGGVPIALLLRDVAIPISPLPILAALAGSLVVFTLMLSQTLAGGIEALYTRGDLDLVFSSPLNPRRILTVRFAALAGSAFLAFGLLVTPAMIPLALFGHWRWLGLYGLLAALALAASGVGLALSVALFALIGPRRTRAIAQILAAIIGAAFFLSTQLRTLLGARTANLVAQVMTAAADRGLRLPAIASWPLRAALGEPVPLLAMLGTGAAIFGLVTAWLGRRFAADAAAAQGADVGARRISHKAVGAFAGGVFAATFRKEVRLLTRDIALMAQVLLRVLYLLPASFLLIRNAADHLALVLPGGAAAIAFLSGQVAMSLTWITVSAEESPELLACAPASANEVRNAKLAAGLTPLAALLVLPLAALAAFSPLTALAAALGAAGAAVAAGLLNAWYPSPGKRSEFRRRRSGSLLIGLALSLISLLIGGATALLAIGWPWFLAPALAAAGILLAMRRSPAQIADALAAQSS